MTAPVAFRSCNSGHRDLAFIGDNMIGYVVDHCGGTRVQAYWRCLLFDGTQQRPASTRAMGRKLLLKRAAEWFDATGRDDCAKVATDLRMQAEGEG
jgi:hypothetical protein